MQACFLFKLLYMPANYRQFIYTHAVYPICALIIVTVAIILWDIDRVFADYVYALQGQTWAWKNTWWAEEFFHKGGRTASLLLALAGVGLLITAYCRNDWARHRKSLCYLMLATAGSSLLVSVLKSSLAVSCPWEFARYGGSLSYNNVIEQIVLHNGKGCFPAGHASAGYAWMALYFFGLSYQSAWRWFGLIIPLAAGVVFGIVQQIRGAHFISHDVWTLAVCWLFSVLLYVLMFKEDA